MANRGIEPGPVTIDRTTTAADERSVGQLVADVSRDLSDIVRHEIALAKAELRTDVRNGAVGGGLFAAAGYFAFLAVIILVIAGGYGLTETGLPAWAAFLIVGGTLLLLAGLFVLVGVNRVKKVGPPERAIKSVKDTLAAVRPGGNGS
jgi:hypothetical protein